MTANMNVDALFGLSDKSALIVGRTPSRRFTAKRVRPLSMLQSLLWMRCR
jgi:accessory colonization factor AcfC